MDNNWHNGYTREVALEVLAYLIDHHLGLASRLFIKLGSPTEIERQVVNAQAQGILRRGSTNRWLYLSAQRLFDSLDRGGLWSLRRRFS